MNPSFTFTAVGVIHSPYKDLKDIPRQGYLSGELTAEIEIFEECADAASTMLEGGRYVVLFVFDKSEGYDLMLVPKGGAGEVRGLFSTRTPERINPIGLSEITVKAVNGRSITFTGVDMLDGTPVLDIKPAM
ncbi:MAG: tRNA (N6-threonylcarbamoyladenosine(37)-N6)-methyltransferase TrmO [Eubacteriaceae bacterium]|nr:tRNA (N6-threonylcarbamoyladenosine(37)-N6)-methyltransferase TrmO [Eubacteriaceae bacterium]